MNYRESVKYLFSRELFGMKLGLDNIRGLLCDLGNPQDSFKSIHVAGTNGKGSTCAFIASILEKQGYKVGLYTSPHLVDFRERIRIGEKLIPKKDMARLLGTIKPLVRTHTYFEITTALAFLYFKEQGVDFAVVEVGMGGRLDATNVIDPEISVITNVSFDHMHHLGDTISKIAYEKAGIIKPGADVVTAAKGDALKVIRKTCKEKGCSLHVSKEMKIRNGLNGEFQNKNVSLAIKAAEVLRGKGHMISEKSIKDGIRKARWPGRLEFLGKNILLDCCHNPDGAKILSYEMKKIRKSYGKVCLILGIMQDKDIGGVCRPIEQLADEIVLTRARIKRAASPEVIATFLKRKPVIKKDIKEAIGYAKKIAGKKDLIVIAGSIYLAGEAYSALGLKPFDS